MNVFCSSSSSSEISLIRICHWQVARRIAAVMKGKAVALVVPQDVAVVAVLGLYTI
jgi:hypothetical protein